MGQTFRRLDTLYVQMETLLTDLQALVQPWLHELLNHLGLDPNRGSLLDRILLLAAGKALAVALVVWGQRLLLHVVRRTFAFIHRRNECAVTAPHGSALQMTVIFVRTLTVLAVAGILLDLTVNRLVTLVSALAALLVLMFRDTVLGFVSGTLLLRNHMIRPGDYLSLTNPNVQGQIEEINIMTVRLRAHDNTFHYVPTYALLTRTFQNWSGMVERGARMVSPKLRLDVASLRSPTDSEALNLRRFRAWVTDYLRTHPNVSPQPFLLVRYPLAEGYGFAVELLFFVRSTAWLEVETIQTEILEDIVGQLPAFGLRLYQISTPPSRAPN